MTNLGGNILNNAMIRVGADSFLFLSPSSERRETWKCERRETARRSRALAFHSAGSDLEIRRWGKGVGQRSSRPLDNGGGRGGGDPPPKFFGPAHMFIQTQGVPDRSRVKKPLAELLEVERALIRFTHADILLIYFSTI